MCGSWVGLAAISHNSDLRWLVRYFIEQVQEVCSCIGGTSIDMGAPAEIIIVLGEVQCFFVGLRAESLL